MNTGQSINGTSGTPSDDIGATSAWAHATGAGVTVAVVDTGVDSTASDPGGANRCALKTLLHGRGLKRGRYAISIRAGGQTVTITLKVV